jgi:uncharacterized protein (TIGR02118 family)
VDKHSELERQVFARGRIKKITATFMGASLVGELPWDGFVELYFDSNEDLQATFQDNDELMKKDEVNFCDPEHRIVALTEEVVIAG